MRLVIASLGFVVWMSVAGQAADPRRKLLEFGHRQAASAVPQGQILVRPRLLSPSIKSIPYAGTSLSVALGEEDILSVVASYAISSEELQKKRDSLLVNQATPDSIMIMRDQSVFVFPRLFLLHPAAQQMQIRNGDVLLTLSLNEDREGSSSDVAKMKLLPPAVVKRDDLSVSVAVFGPLYPQVLPGSWTFQAPRAGVSPFEELRNASISTLLRQRKAPQAARTIEESIHEKFGSSLDNQIAVFALRRMAYGRVVTFICPLQKIGVFRRESNIFKTLRDPRSPDDTVWKELVDQRFYSVPLLDGDTIELTTLENVGPFRSLSIPD